MMPKKKVPTATNPNLALYNSLMAEIEPELVSYVIPLLDYWYKDETPDERKARFKRYVRAFEVFEERFGHLLQLWQGQLLEVRDAAMVGVQAEETEKDVNRLHEIDTALGQS